MSRRRGRSAWRQWGKGFFLDDGPMTDRKMSRALRIAHWGALDVLDEEMVMHDLVSDLEATHGPMSLPAMREPFAWHQGLCSGVDFPED